MGLKRWIAAAIVSLAAAGAAFAQGPEEIVRGIYEGGGARSSIDRLRAPGVRNRHFQPALVRLFDANDRDECIDFGLHINGQDFDEAEIARSLRLQTRLDGDRAAVDARFRSFGKTNHFRFEFARSGDAWKIADIMSLTPDARWRLSQVPCRGAPTAAPASAQPQAGGLEALRRPGRYCFANRISELRISVAPSGSARVEIDHLGGGMHTCGLEGDAKPAATGWQLELEGVKGPCRLELVVSPAGRLTTRDPGGACKATYCGLRADIADLTLDLRRDKRRCRG